LEMIYIGYFMHICDWSTFFCTCSLFSLSDVVLQVPSHSAVFINEPRLSEFKQIVVSKGIQAEMSGGVLICNNVVAVRRVRYATIKPLLYGVNITLYNANLNTLCITSSEQDGSLKNPPFFTVPQFNSIVGHYVRYKYFYCIAITLSTLVYMCQKLRKLRVDKVIAMKNYAVFCSILYIWEFIIVTKLWCDRNLDAVMTVVS